MEKVHDVNEFKCQETRFLTFLQLDSEMERRTLSNVPHSWSEVNHWYMCNECDLEVCVVPWFCKYHTRSEVEKFV